MQISIAAFAFSVCGLFHGWHVQASAPMQSREFAESVQVSCKEKTDVQGSEETSLLQVKGGSKQGDELHGAQSSPDCCATDTGSFLGMFAGTCADGTPGTPYCGVEECNAAGCACKGGCRKPAGWDLPDIGAPMAFKPFSRDSEDASDIEYALNLVTLCHELYALYHGDAEKEKAEKAIGEIGYKVWWQKPDEGELTMKAIFVNNAAKRAVLAIKGDISGDRDREDRGSGYDRGSFVDNIGTFHMYPKTEVEEIQSLKEKIESQFAGYSILITGHLLGGYLAEVGATHFDLPGMAFCAPAPGKDHNGKARPKNFQILNAWYDKLGNMDGWVFKEKHFKPVMYLKDMEEHHESTMMRLLQEQAPELTNYEPWVQYVLHGQYKEYFTPYNDNPTSPNCWKAHVRSMTTTSPTAE